jgi:hypothetical protein
MQIAQIAPLTEAIPPKLYGGTERVNAADRRYFPPFGKPALSPMARRWCGRFVPVHKAVGAASWREGRAAICQVCRFAVGSTAARIFDGPRYPRPAFSGFSRTAAIGLRISSRRAGAANRAHDAPVNF